jgi:1,2-phenylacetyl-CoA epoxidase catalytic subunit
MEVSMRNAAKVMAIAAIGVFLTLGSALAQNQDRTQQQIGDRDIYGYQMMTPQERNEYRNRMRTATTAEERERIRAEHHAQMLARAKERGVTLPQEPPAGMGPGGAGQGGPMGRGRR